MAAQPGRNFTRLAVAIVIAALAISAAALSYSAVEATVTTTKTVTDASLSGSPVVTEQVIIQSELINEVCILSVTNATSTVYVVPASTNSTTPGNQRTTTETLSSIGISTVYENVTIYSDGSTCTYINQHYNASESCGPCQ